MKGYLRTAIAAAFLVLSVASTQQAYALGTEKSATRNGFTLPAQGPIRILVFRPDVQVGEQSTAGLNQANAEWTATARAELGKALEKIQASKSNDLVSLPDLEGEDGAFLADYRALFKVVTDTVFSHRLFPGNRLPTKRDDLQWTLGPGVAKLGEIGGGDYGLFIYTYDSYGSAGRKAMQIFGALMGVGITSGVHIGYAGLVDLRTGDLVWVNADVQMGGDVRDPIGAEKRITQLLEDFPQRGPAPPL